VLEGGVGGSACVGFGGRMAWEDVCHAAARVDLVDEVGWRIG
jgi:hypothetical protein